MMTKMCEDKMWECATNLRAWMSGAQINVVFAEGESNSWYVHDQNNPVIVLGTGWDGTMGDDPFTVGHEYGHSIFRAVFDKYGIFPNCDAIKDGCDTIKDKCDMLLSSDCNKMAFRHMARIHISLKKKGYGLTTGDLSPISDFVGMYLNAEVSGYLYHDIGYADLFADEYNGGVNHIYEDEWFANICGMLNDSNWNALRAIHEIYPVALASCFIIIDKAMVILKEKVK